MDVGNPFSSPQYVRLNRVSEVLGRSTGSSLQVSENILIYRLAGSRSVLPDLQTSLIERDNEKYIDILDAARQCYNPNWVAKREMPMALRRSYSSLIR